MKKGDSIKISINDTGTGIPTDKLSFIFNRFYKASITIGRKYGGVGPGLYI
ncbi:MAG TPA: histidine kinase, partial [Methanosarcinales archaeon]|nr:histidine kinase [Methanosarcinales archaeon]